MNDFFRFTVEFFRDPKKQFGALMLVIAGIAAFNVFPLISLDRITDPLGKILLYFSAVAPTFLAAWALLTKPSPPDSDD